MTITEIGTNSLFGTLADEPHVAEADSPSLPQREPEHRCAQICRTPGTRRPPSWATGATTQIVLRSTTTASPRSLFGQYGQNLALIERRLGVVADQRGNQVTIEGSRDGCEQARRVLEGLYEQLKRGDDSRPATSKARSASAIAQGSLFDLRPGDRAAALRGDQPAQAAGARRTAAQDAYIRALQAPRAGVRHRPGRHRQDLALAVAHAVQLFERKEVDRIILSRPAVEAGERLGFLPGDMREKVDPYLRPIYDALYDLMDARIVERALQTGEIEIAPLAFMRGRTLSNAVVILDEAQNTTSMQMKMFLTRLGENSRMIVTGDPSQVDLPPGQTSGLREATRLLTDVEGIGTSLHRRGRDPPRAGGAHRRGLRRAALGTARGKE